MTTRQAEDTEALDVAGLVRRAGGDRWAWERLVDQYARLIWAITRDFKLVESDAADVAQVSWLRLLENIHKIENPDRVGSWLAATARNECLRNLAARKRVVLADDDVVLDGAAIAEPDVDEGLLSAGARGDGPRGPVPPAWRWQRMLEMLMADPRPPTQKYPSSSGSRSEALAHPQPMPGSATRPLAHVVRSRCRAQHPAREGQPRAGTEPSASATTQRPPAASTSGKAARTSGRRSARNRTTAAGR